VSRLLFELSVDMEDSEPFQVVADQRDIAKWEVQPFGSPFNENAERTLKGVTFLRFIAWSAASRQQLTRLSWADFDARCVEVNPLDEDKSAIPADADRPGRPAPSATRSSRSRTRADKR
jgi:hypothetical protein